MPQTQPTWLQFVRVVAALIALGSLSFTVILYFVTRRFSELRYETTELSDFKLPREIVADLIYAPVAIRIESTGNKAADNVGLEVVTKGPINKYEIDPRRFVPRLESNELYLSIERLNPTETVRIFLSCNGNPTESQLSTPIKLTHADKVVRKFTDGPSRWWPVTPAVVFAIAIAAISAGVAVPSYVAARAATKGSCGGKTITGTEDINWNVTIDSRTGKFSGYNPVARETRKVDVDVYCFPKSVFIAQRNSTDGNNCDYILNREGSILIGSYTCSSVSGIHPFNGSIK